MVPHQRLAHQLWHRQRLAALAEGRPAWEPLPLVTLQAWWSNLFNSLWPKEALASPLRRLALWRQALQAAPPPTPADAELAWAQALDETHTLLCRHRLAGGDARPTRSSAGDDSPLVAWRRRVTRVYEGLLREGRWITPGGLPGYLLGALQAGRLSLPREILVVGLETPAPAEAAWLQEIGRRARVAHLQVKGDPQAVHRAVVLPDRDQELAWVAAQLLEAVQGDGLPLHRLAVTSPELDSYDPALHRVLAQILGAAGSPAGWAYNFSQGPHLAATPLFQAGLLPLKFIAAREAREDLVALLLSPYYGNLSALQGKIALWDRVWREQRVDQGWNRLEKAVAQHPRTTDADSRLLDRLGQVWTSFKKTSTATGREWADRLQRAWRELGFPQGLAAEEPASFTRLTALLQELAAALGSEVLGVGEFLDWLSQGARRLLLPGPGVQEAGIQVLGLLEMRGLDFARVFCLGMNSGAFPQPPRPLPLLSASEKRTVLGGTYKSQHHFARELWENFLGCAPRITLTRPRLADQEERVSTPMYLGAWDEAGMAPLSRPHPAWLRVPAIRAAFTMPAATFPGYADGLMPLALPAVLSLSRASVALECPCRFLLEVMLHIRELPEIQAGLDSRERGDRLHKVLARFTTEFKKILDSRDTWDQAQATALLKEAAHQILAHLVGDLHWQAEWDRWLGEGGLLWKWLHLEKARFERGWGWHGMEVRFQGLQGEDWPFALTGRIDRLDYRGKSAEVIIWDYKSGEVPKAKQVFDEGKEFQLPCYLLAVDRGLVAAPPETARARAGFIGLKSPRENHLRHEDFAGREDQWAKVLTAFAATMADLGQRLSRGDFLPRPNPAPAGKQKGACQYCPYPLVCGFTPEVPLDEPEEAE